MKKTFLTLIIIVIAAIIFWIVIPSKSQLVTPQTPLAQTSSSPLPTPSPAPIKLDQNTNLSEESQKLTVPDYQADYKALDQTLSNF